MPKIDEASLKNSKGYKQYQVVGEGEARETETQPPVLSLQQEMQDLAYNYVR